MKRLSGRLWMAALAWVLTCASPAWADDRVGQHPRNAGQPKRELADWQAIHAPGYVQTLDVLQDFTESPKGRRLGANRGPVLVATAGPPPEAIREAQELLAKLGYAPGPANGVWNQSTVRAYRAFLRDLSRPDSSKLVPQALQVMRRLVERGIGGSVKERKQQTPAGLEPLTPAQQRALDRYLRRQAQQQRQGSGQERERYRQTRPRAQELELTPAQQRAFDRYLRRQAR